MAQTKAARKAAMARKQAARKAEGTNYVGRVIYAVREGWEHGARPNLVVEQNGDTLVVVPFSSTVGTPIFGVTATNGLEKACDLRPQGRWELAIREIPTQRGTYRLTGEELELAALRIEEG